jgi:hypothetical protein
MYLSSLTWETWNKTHQHLVLFNYIAMGHPKTFLEHISHRKRYLAHPVQWREGRFKTPRGPESNADLVLSVFKQKKGRIGRISQTL